MPKMENPSIGQKAENKIDRIYPPSSAAPDCGGASRICRISSQFPASGPVGLPPRRDETEKGFNPRRDYLQSLFGLILLTSI
jgi:hypothetical protein